MGGLGMRGPQQLISIRLRGLGALIVLFACVAFSHGALAQFVQQDVKLVPADTFNNSVQFGWASALSGDGDTAIIGGRFENNLAGAAWIYTRSGGTWANHQKLLANNA